MFRQLGQSGFRNLAEAALMSSAGGGAEPFGGDAVAATRLLGGAGAHSEIKALESLSEKRALTPIQSGRAA